MWLAFFANRLTQEKKSSTLRDVYYSSQAFAIEFEDQSESDNIIVDLEAVLSKPREDFHIFPEERSSIFGDLNIEYTIPGYEGKKLAWCMSVPVCLQPSTKACRCGAQASGLAARVHSHIFFSVP